MKFRTGVHTCLPTLIVILLLSFYALLTTKVPTAVTLGIILLARENTVQ